MRYSIRWVTHFFCPYVKKVDAQGLGKSHLRGITDKNDVA